MLIAIIGAGFGGLCMAIRLKRAGFGSFVVFEKAGDVGGTWRDNTYPGAGCDVPSHLYSYSFEKYSSWSRRYPGQPEILEYIRQLTDKYGLRSHIRFNTEIAQMRYNAGRWHLTTADGAEHVADAVVSGVGQLNRPRMPEIPGMSSFRGTSFHSARWNHDHDVTGRDVAVIGTGSSGAQLIPPVARAARRLYVFQRTPNWVIPKPDAHFGAAAKLGFHYLPFLQRLYRHWIYLRAETTLWPAIRRGWSTKLVERMARKQLEAQVPDPGLRRKLTPDYPIGCKRIIIDSAFYPALTRENVEVVTEKISQVTEDGVETADGRLRRADTIVYATGFNTTDFLTPIEVIGREGRRLHDEWAEGAEAYLGIAAPYFPGLYFLYGPNTNLGHNSIIFMIECQVGYILSCLRESAREGRPMEVRPEAMAAYRRSLERAMSRTVWEAGCHSWYKNEAGRVTNNWPMPTTVYRRLMRAPHPRAFRPAPAGRQPYEPPGRTPARR